MKRPTEKVFQDRALRKLKSLRGSWWVKVMEAEGGTPDVLGCVQGNFVAIEFKRDKTSRATKLQLWTHDVIRDRADGVVYIAHPDNWDEIFEEIKIMARAKRWR